MNEQANQPNRKKRGAPQLSWPPERSGTGRIGETADERQGSYPDPSLGSLEELQKALEELSRRLDILEQPQPTLKEREPVLTATTIAGVIGAILAAITGYQLSQENVDALQFGVTTLLPLLSSIGAGYWARKTAISPATYNRDLEKAREEASYPQRT